MMLRIQSPEGTRRIEISDTSQTVELYEKVCAVFELGGFTFALYCKRDKSQEIRSSKSSTIKKYGLTHGDMIYLFPLPGEASTSRSEDAVEDKKVSTAVSRLDLGKTGFANTSVRSSVQEDEVDLKLYGLKGTIERKRDPRNCLHGDNSSCLHCLPLEPYDSTYLKEQNIKYMSFHAYLRSLSRGLDRGKFANLENISCRIKPGCTGHPPWPKGVCSKCQPKAITMNSQPYRHVDNIVFENPNLVERFLAYWRATGNQRVGFLYGRYDVHLDVPLGIKAVVSAIYEPPQESTRDTLRLLEDPKKEILDQIANKLGLKCVGWIFTDLVTEDPTKGTVKHFRKAESHFLSAQECINAGHFQSLYPNPCRLSSDGYFGSKFVTVIVTGDEKHQVHMEGYQVSNQCQALVRDDCLVPTKDAPELAYVRESTPERCIPDVYYKLKDTYGNEVTRVARPLPIEYLLVDIPVSTPLEPIFTFRSESSGIRGFPIENRNVDGHLQDVHALATYLKQFAPNRFLDAASDFHFLIYIATMDMFPLMTSMDPLLDAVRTRDALLAEEWAAGEQWSTVLQLLAHADDQMMTDDHPMSGMPSQGASSQGGQWTCAHCTFINPPHLTSCEICNLPQTE